MGDQKSQGIVRIVKAFGYSVNGLKAVFRNEQAFRQELGFFVILAPLGAWLGQGGIERALLIGSLFLVLVVELLNSSIEALVDRVGRERHELSGRAKDAGSAAVLIAIVNVFVVWGVVLIF